MSLWLLAREQHDRLKRAAEARATQAALVAAWVSSVHPTATPYPEIRIRVRNASSMPIYQVSFQFVAGVRGTWIRYMRAIGPQETREFLILLPGHMRAEPGAPSLAFTDGAGRRWLRSSEGDLRELGLGEEVRFQEDPAQAGTVENHPTLHMPEEEWMSGGKIVP